KYLSEKGGDIPTQRSAVVSGLVGEPVHLTQHHAVGTHLRADHSAGGGAQIDGGEDAGARHQRRNAAATPESTGMCRPVVWLRSSPASATTAAATCSGSTSRPSRVRLA